MQCLLFEQVSHFPGGKMRFESCTYLQMIDVPVVKTCDFPAIVVSLQKGGINMYHHWTRPTS